MGLDITAYAYARFVCPFRGGAGKDDTLVYLYPNPDFPTQADGMAEGWYDCSVDSDSSWILAFRAGSYSGYGRWRALLARMAGYSAEPRRDWTVPAAGPFVELINFSDCQGIIGPRTSAKLAKDFREWKDRAAARSHLAGMEFVEQYHLWHQAFEMAAGAGVVDFH